MKSFRQFCEEASLSDLQRQYEVSPEGRSEARKSAVKRARSESKRRRDLAKQFTQRNKQKSLQTMQSAQQQLAQQQSDVEERKKQLERKQRISRKRASKTGKNIRSAIKGTAELTKKIIKGVTNRRER